jgi:hypothetical protein
MARRTLIKAGGLQRFWHFDQCSSADPQSAAAVAVLQSNILADSGNIREFRAYFRCPARIKFMHLSL